MLRKALMTLELVSQTETSSKTIQVQITELTRNSEYFATLFSGQFKESPSRPIRIVVADVEVAEHLIRVLEGDPVDFNRVSVFELMKLADYWLCSMELDYQSEMWSGERRYDLEKIVQLTDPDADIEINWQAYSPFEVARLATKYGLDNLWKLAHTEISTEWDTYEPEQVAEYVSECTISQMDDFNFSGASIPFLECIQATCFRIHFECLTEPLVEDTETTLHTLLWLSSYYPDLLSRCREKFQDEFSEDDDLDPKWFRVLKPDSRDHSTSGYQYALSNFNHLCNTILVHRLERADDKSAMALQLRDQILDLVDIVTYETACRLVVDLPNPAEFVKAFLKKKDPHAYKLIQYLT